MENKNSECGRYYSSIAHLVQNENQTNEYGISTVTLVPSLEGGKYYPTIAHRIPSHDETSDDSNGNISTEVAGSRNLNNSRSNIGKYAEAANNCNMGNVKFNNQGSQELETTKDNGSNAEDKHGNANISYYMIQANGMVLDTNVL